MKKFLVCLLVFSLLISIPVFAGNAVSKDESSNLTERQKNIFRAYGLSEEEITNITPEKIKEVIQKGKIVDYSFLVKETPSYLELVTKEYAEKFKNKGLNEKHIDALLDMGYEPKDIEDMSEDKLKEAFSKTELAYGTDASVLRATPPPGYNCVTTIPDGGGSDEWFHPSVDVSSSSIDFYVQASKLCASYLFTDTTYSHLRYSYNLYGEWGEDAHPTWCHEGVDLQNVYYGRGRAVQAVATGTVTKVDRTGYGAVMVYNPTLGVVYNYQHMTNIPSTITLGSTVTLGNRIGDQSDIGADGAVHTHVGTCTNSSSCQTLHSGRDLVFPECSDPYIPMIYFIP